MKKFLLLLIASPTLLNAQSKEIFDIVSYSAPKGWKKETKESGITFTTEDDKKGTFCAIAIFKSLPGSNDSKKNFDASWDGVVKEMVTVSAAPTIQPPVTDDGWEAISGFTSFESDGTKGVVLLVTTSGYEKMASIVVLFNTEDHQATIEKFLQSVEMIKPIVQHADGKKTDNTIPKTANSGITKSTTTFTDGWTAKAMEDYVLVTKENTKFYIHYGIPVPLEQRGAEESWITKFYWEKYISPRYTITNLWLNPDVGYMSSFNNYAEGTGIEKSTGKNVFIGFRVITENGVFFCSEAASATKEEYQKHFPTLNMLKDMRKSNRFAITRQDVVGDWSSSGSSNLQYYNVYTGANAGMTFSSGGQDFFFKPNGLYNARIAGNMGTMGGSQAVFDNKYNGQFTISDWEITLTKYSGSTTVFTAYFEAVKGGRILHIAKKNAPGIQYPLVKVK